MPKAGRSDLDAGARYQFDGRGLIRTDSQGRTDTLDRVRLLIDLAGGVIAHGHPEDVAPLHDRIAHGHDAAGCPHLKDNLLAFTFEADETVPLRLNRALEKPTFAVRLAQRVLEANDMPVPHAELTDITRGAPIN